MTCCFIGHRKISETPELRVRLEKLLLDLAEGGTFHFLFGDHSAFDALCYELVTELKKNTLKFNEFITAGIMRTPVMIRCGFC